MALPLIVPSLLQTGGGLLQGNLAVGQEGKRKRN